MSRICQKTDASQIYRTARKLGISTGKAYFLTADVCCSVAVTLGEVVIEPTLPCRDRIISRATLPKWKYAFALQHTICVQRPGCRSTLVMACG